MYLVETGDVPSDVFPFTEGVIVAVVGFPEVVVVVEAFECGRRGASGDVEGFLDLLGRVSLLRVSIQVRHDVRLRRSRSEVNLGIVVFEPHRHDVPGCNQLYPESISVC